MSRSSVERVYSLSEAQIEAFRRDGYVRLGNVFSEQELEAWDRAISARVLERSNVASIDWQERSTYQKAFIQVMNLWRDHETIRRLVFDPRLARIAAELMGVDGVRLYHDQALYKEPARGHAGGHTPWHADQYYWPLDTPDTVTAWIPLQAVPAEMGPLAFAVGSQRFEAGRDLSISDQSEAELSQAMTEAGFEIDDRPFELGEVSFHSGWTFHRAGPNRSASTRKVMTVIYMDVAARVKQPENENQQLDWQTWIPGVAVGGVAASPLNPVLFEKAT